MPAGWEGILDADETILWQGGPRPEVKFEGPVMGAVMGLVFMGFSIFWMKMAMRAPGPFWMFGLIFFFAGFYNGIGVHFWKAYLRSQTFYTLSSKRAFVATAHPFKGRRLKSYPITANAVLSWDGMEPGTVVFAQEARNREDALNKTDVGFEQIEGGREVFRLMREVQTKLAS